MTWQPADDSLKGAFDAMAANVDMYEPATPGAWMFVDGVMYLYDPKTEKWVSETGAVLNLESR